MKPEPSGEASLFQAAATLAGAERAAFLDRECVGMAALRARLEALLAAHDQPDTQFELVGVARLRSEVPARKTGHSLQLEGVDTFCGLATVSFAPRCIRDYELLDESARGGSGVVYRARQKSLDRLVAVKMLLIGPLASPAAIQRFQIEALAAAALHHPNIVAIHEVGVHEGQHFLVMDYVGGPSLAQQVKQQALPPNRAAQYLRTIAEAVHYAHERGILHRDLKPSNVLIDTNDHPRLTDFGLAKRFSVVSSPDLESHELTISGQIMGSPAYMAPEQANGALGKVSVRSDVYSLGATLYHLLTGRPPFITDWISETLEQVQTREAVPPRLLNPSVPLDLETICLKCLEKDPANRYASALILAEELARFENNEPITAHPTAVTHFTESQWTEENFVRRYREVADYVLPDRQRLFQVLRSFFRHHLAGRCSVRVCDLGCGDGTLSMELLAVDASVDLTLVDGSTEALATARRRLGERARASQVLATFDAIIRGEIRIGPFDFIVSSFAIHHLYDAEKFVLFQRLIEALQPGGWLMNIDVTLPDQKVLTGWLIELWRDQILEAERQAPPPSSCRNVPEESWNNPDNKYATLGSQLKALRSAGFLEVDCHYRNGIFGIYSGRKPSLPGGR